MSLPTVESFYASLDPKDRIIHDLAVKMLKTRYDPVRSNAFRAFAAAEAKKTMPSPAVAEAKLAMLSPAVAEAKLAMLSPAVAEAKLAMLSPAVAEAAKK